MAICILILCSLAQDRIAHHIPSSHKRPALSRLVSAAAILAGLELDLLFIRAVSCSYNDHINQRDDDGLEMTMEGEVHVSWPACGGHDPGRHLSYVATWACGHVERTQDVTGHVEL